MRIRLPLGRTLFFVVAFLFALLATLPLRLALEWFAPDNRGFSAREAGGSIWLGWLSEPRIGAVALGDLQASLRTLPLFAGLARLDLERDDPAAPFDGSVTLARHRFGVDDLTARLDLSRALAPLPLGVVDLSDLDVHFADGQCKSAQGLVKTTVGGDLAGMPLSDGLGGAARCDGGALLLPLASTSGMAKLDLRLFDGGSYAMELMVLPSDDIMRDRLLGSGFRLSGSGYAMTANGKF